MPRSRFAPLISLAGALLLASTQASAGTEKLYSCVDTNGGVRFSQTPMPNRPCKEMIISTGSSKPVENNISTSNSQPTPAADAKVPAGTTPPKPDPKICETAKKNLETLDAKALVRVQDEYGEYRVLDDNERAAEVEKAKKAVSLNCK